MIFLKQVKKFLICTNQINSVIAKIKSDVTTVFQLNEITHKRLVERVLLEKLSSINTTIFHASKEGKDKENNRGEVNREWNNQRREKKSRMSKL